MRFKCIDMFFMYPFALSSLEVLNHWEHLYNFDGGALNSEDPEYLPPYIKLRSEYDKLLLKSEEVDCQLMIPTSAANPLAPHSAKISAEIILKKNGGGCCIFRVGIKSPPDTSFSVEHALTFTLIEDYSSVFTLTSPISFGSNFDEIRNGGQLFQLFEEAVGNLISASSKEFQNKIREESLASRKLFIDEEYQHPYVMTVARLAEGSPYDYIAKSSTNSAKNRCDLASLLIRTYAPSGEGADTIDDTYLHHTTEMNHEGLANLYPFQHLFANIHYRSCFAVHGKYNENKQLEDYGEKYINQLKYSVVTARIQWFTLLLLNARIDDLLGRTALSAFDLIEGRLKDKQNENFQEFLETIIKLRTSVSLALNDPVSYGHAAGSFSHLFRRMTTLFRIDKLEASLQVKLQAVDRMYDDLRELYRLNLTKRSE